MQRSSLQTRAISAVILAPLVLGAIYVGGKLFFALVTLVLGLAAFEFVKLMERGDFHPTLLFAWGFVGVGLFVAQDPAASGDWLPPTMTGLMTGALVWQLFRPPNPVPTVDWSLTVASGLYVGWMGGHLIALRQMPDGIQWLLLSLGITWSADTGAYLIGSSWGRRKLAPRISPGKTWEGTAGGWLTGILTGGLLAGILSVGTVHGLALGTLIGIASPLGDLSISMIKRQVGAKDSSRLIPGHGGMLDRIDSVLFTVVVGYYYLRWVVL